jgi:hypothetical protein
MMWFYRDVKVERFAENTFFSLLIKRIFCCAGTYLKSKKKGLTNIIRKSFENSW